MLEDPLNGACINSVQVSGCYCYQRIMDERAESNIISVRL